GAADRGVVLEVIGELATWRSGDFNSPTRQLANAPILIAHRWPAALHRPAAGGRRSLAGLEARLRARSERDRSHALERFSAAQAAGVRARNTDRSFRPVLRTAIRARIRHHDWQRAPARPPVVH